MLAQVLLRGQEPLGGRAVLVGIGRARGRARERVAVEHAVAHRDQELGARPDQVPLVAGQLDVEHVRVRVGPAHGRAHRAAVERLGCGHVERARQDDLLGRAVLEPGHGSPDGGAEDRVVASGQRVLGPGDG
ncbi:hypothetical protein D3C74_358410 [compost metagenome]